MAIIRVKKNGNFTTMSNVHLRDKKLSWKAKGLLSYILSLPDDWELYQSELINHAANGERSTRTAFKQLVKHGYITKHQKRNKDGTFKEVEYNVYEHGSTETAKCSTGLCSTGKRNTTKDIKVVKTNSTKDLFTDSSESAYIYFNNLDSNDLVRQTNNYLETGRSKISHQNYSFTSDIIDALVADQGMQEWFSFIDDYLIEKQSGRSVEDFIKRIYREYPEYYNEYER